MKIPRRLEDISRRKDKFIARSDARITLHLKKMQDVLISRLVSEIIPKLDVSKGVIRNTVYNYRLLTTLDSLYNDFIKGQKVAFVERIDSTLKEIGKINTSFFSISAGVDVSALSVAAKAAEAKLMLRIGIEGGEMVAGGFLETLIENKTTLLGLKKYVAQAITGGADTKVFIKGLTEIVTGAGKEGGFESQYNRFAHDMYMQYDRAQTTSIAGELGMNKFIYQGGLMGDSRDFCAAHNNKTFTKEEAEKWRTWTPAKGEFPAGYEIKQKDKNKVPSYIDYPGYEPLIDLGGYNCRHWLGWLMDEVSGK